MPGVRMVWRIAIAAIICGGGCGRFETGPRPTGWTTGFWFWQGSHGSGGTGINNPVDVLYCQTGTIGARLGPSVREAWPGWKEPWPVHENLLPENLPSAREYWLVFRAEGPGIPPVRVAAELARKVAIVQADARRRGLTVAGIQLDVDSPTRALSDYAAFLRELRKHLAPGVQISMTALLDWFRRGTSIAEVVGAVDEFVPQFYDVQEWNPYSGGYAIAARFDASQWGPIFDRYQKRYRIGISTFGRARLLAHLETRMIQDIEPLDFAVNPVFKLETLRTEARELRLRYRATADAWVGYHRFGAGDLVEFTLPALEAIGAAVSQARAMGNYCAGVVFFRWPAFNEVLTLPPADVLAAAGAAPSVKRLAELRVVEGDCAAVHCVDIFLVNPHPLAAKPISIVIASSSELEYFLPRDRMPVRMSGPTRLQVSVPAYGGRTLMQLGRAVSLGRAEFRIEEER